MIFPRRLTAGLASAHAARRAAEAQMRLNEAKIGRGLIEWAKQRYGSSFIEVRGPCVVIHAKSRVPKVRARQGPHQQHAALDKNKNPVHS